MRPLGAPLAAITTSLLLAITAGCGGSSGDSHETTAADFAGAVAAGSIGGDDEQAPLDGDGAYDGEAMAPEDLDCGAATGNEDWYNDFCPPKDYEPAEPKPWAVGEDRVIVVPDADDLGNEAQLQVTLQDVKTVDADCDGPQRVKAVLLDFRVENVSTVTAELGYTNLGAPYWLSDSNQRIDGLGCAGDETPLNTVGPGQNTIGTERLEFPDEPGRIIYNTAFPFIESAIEIPGY